MTKPREKVIETEFKKQAAKRGLLAMKFISQGKIGVPDQIVTGSTGSGRPRLIFVELKRPDRRPDPVQVSVHEQLRNHGATVVTIDHLDGVIEFFDLAYGPDSTPDTEVPETFYVSEQRGPTQAPVFKF